MCVALPEVSSYCLGNGCALLLGRGLFFLLLASLPQQQKNTYMIPRPKQHAHPHSAAKRPFAPLLSSKTTQLKSCGMVKLQALSVIWHVRGRHVSLNPRPKKTSTPNPQNTNALANNTNIIILASMDALGNCCSQEICGHDLYICFPTQAGLVTIGITWPQVLHISKV